MRAEKGEAGTSDGRGRELTGGAGLQEAQRGAGRGGDRQRGGGAERRPWVGVVGSQGGEETDSEGAGPGAPREGC